MNMRPDDTPLSEILGEPEADVFSLLQATQHGFPGHEGNIPVLFGYSAGVVDLLKTQHGLEATLYGPRPDPLGGEMYYLLTEKVTFILGLCDMYAFEQRIQLANPIIQTTRITNSDYFNNGYIINLDVTGRELVLNAQGIGFKQH